MRVDQFVAHLAPRDALGMDALTLRSWLRASGYESNIYTITSAKNNYHIYPLSGYNPSSQEPSWVIHHMAIGSPLPYVLGRLPGKILTRYHNITPPNYFPSLYQEEKRVCSWGRQQRSWVAQQSYGFWCPSAYNSKELSAFAEKPVKILPPLGQYEDLWQRDPDLSWKEKLKRLGQGKKIWLFVGRVSPHKAHHDLLFYLKAYQNLHGAAQLWLVGSQNEIYLREHLFPLAEKLGLSLSKNIEAQGDVVTFGSLSQEQLVATYQTANLFISLSDHEGFGVPLIEAMGFDLPVLAHEAGAIPETLGEKIAKFAILHKNSPQETLEKIHAFLNCPDLYQEAIIQGRKRAENFRNNWLKSSFQEACRFWFS